MQQALATAKTLGDVGGELRYLSAIANGTLLAGYPPIALGFTDRALTLASKHPETGFPFVAYSTKILTLIALHRLDEAERFARAAIVEARTGDRRIKEIELHMMLARIAESRKPPEWAIEYLEQARTSAAAGHVQRLLADAEEGLAQAFRARGDLTTAGRHAAAAVAHTRAAGTRFTLPIRLGVLAGINAAQGRLAVADRLYGEAADIVEGMMVNVPSRTAQARLVGVMSDLYAGHFGLVAGRLADAHKAFRVIERARGRALADVLRAVPADDPNASADARGRVVAALQLRLMRARTAGERQRILEDLWEAEQRATVPAGEGGMSRVPLGRRGDAGVAAVQRTLEPTEVLVEYVLLEPRSYCLVITRRALALVALPGRARIESLVERFRDDVRGNRGVEGPSSRELYNAIVEPVSAHWRGARRLFLVPEGQLHLLPFEALVAANTPEAPAIAIAPSASVLALLRVRVERARPDRPLDDRKH